MNKALTFLIVALSFAALLAAPIRGIMGFKETLEGSSPLPHGAIPVQYIESTGEQYIDTGVLPLNGFQLDCQLQVTKFNDGMMGVCPSDTRLSYLNCYLNFYGSRVYPRFGKGFPAGAYIYFTTTSLSMNRDGFWVNGEKTAAALNDIPDAQARFPFYLFAANGGDSVGRFSYLLLFNITLSNYGEVEFDAIPVRFPNELGEWEGAMYDFVSGELFRNQGTSSFVIGPDL